MSRKYRIPIFFKPELSLAGIAIASARLFSQFEFDGEHCKEVVLTESVLREIYPTRIIPVWEETKKRMIGKKVLVVTLLVENREELNELVALIGKNVDPVKCDTGSLRNMFMGKTSKISGSPYLYYRNMIHRPVTLREAKKHFKALLENACCGVN